MELYYKKKLKNKGNTFLKVFVMIILVICFIILSQNRITNEFQEEVESVISNDIKEEVKLENNELVQEEKYIMKIDYPIIENKDVYDKIRLYIQGHKTEFLSMVNKLEVKEGFKYDFIAQNQVLTLGDITTIHILIYYYAGGNHSTRIDRTYHYNNKTNEEIDITYFLNEESSFQKLSLISYYYVMKFAEDEDRKFSDENVKDGTAAILENYSHFSFREDGLNILFPPYQVTSWADGEVEITIPYSELKNIVKEEYIKLAITQEEIDVTKPAKRDLKQFEGKKLIAFTFDDGPNPKTTTKLLNNLEKYNARVTFFVLGSRVVQFKNTLKTAYEQGNQIGSHTYNHLNLLNINNYQVMKEIKKTNEEIEKIIGIKPSLIRPPYGNTNKEIREMANMHTIIWNIDTLDWKTRNAEKIEKEILKNAHDGAIILLHDIYEESIDGALSAMEKLEKEGYAFVTIEEMAELKEMKLYKDKVYYNFIKK